MQLVHAAIHRTSLSETVGRSGENSWSATFPAPGDPQNTGRELSAIAFVGAVDSERRSLASRISDCPVELEVSSHGGCFLEKVSATNLVCIGVVDDRGNRLVVELIRASRENGEGTGVIVLARNANYSDCVHAIRSGAIAYLPFSCDNEELTAAINEAKRLSPAMKEEVELRKRIRTGYDLLTKRETEVLKWLVEGHSNRAIGGKLCLAEATVKIHRRHVMDKMKVSSLAQLIYHYQLIELRSI